MSEHQRPEDETTAKDGAITFGLSFLLWGVLLGITLYAGHSLANYMAAGH